MDYRRASTESELQPVYTTSSLESDVLTDTEEGYGEYAEFYDRHVLDEALGSSISCLNLFERAVQDPYSSGCDNEDSCSINDILSDQFSIHERGSRTPEILNSELSSGETPHLSIAGPGSMSHNYNWNHISARRSPITPDLAARRLTPSGRRSPIILQNPVGASSSTVYDFIDRDRQLLLRRTETAPLIHPSPRTIVGRNQQVTECFNMDSRLTPKRTNTPCGARDTRSPDVAGLASPTFRHVGAPRVNSNALTRQAIRRPASRPLGYIRVDNARSSDQYFPKTGIISFPSSPSVISHLHSLEKYVSSDLDAISLGDKIEEKSHSSGAYGLETPYTGIELVRTASGGKLGLRPDSPISGESTSVTQNSRQNSNLGSRTRIAIPKSHTPVLARPRERSFIERSLSNSFSREC